MKNKVLMAQMYCYTPPTASVVMNLLKPIGTLYSVGLKKSNNMKNILFSRQAKILVNIFLVAVFFLLMSAGHIRLTSDTYWLSAHCIISGVWFLLTILHVAQHWRLIKAFTKMKVISKNKITTLTIICFILMLLSIVSFILGLPLLRFHNLIGRLFILIIIIHTIDKAKRFVSLFKDNKKSKK